MPPDFNWQSYLNANPDVSNALGYSEDAAINHYLNHGQYENRPLRFDWESYLNANPDVSNALGYSEDAAIKHYREYGYKENRQLTGSPPTPTAPTTPTPTTPTPGQKPLSAEYGQSPTIFGGLDYTEAIKNGYSDNQIKAWIQSTNTPFAAETGSRLGLSSTPGFSIGTIGSRIPASEIAPTTAPTIYQGAIIPVYTQNNIEPNLIYDKTNKKWIKTSGTTDNKTDHVTNNKTDYPAAYRTDYKTNYRDDYITDYKTDYRTDYPTNLDTNLSTNNAAQYQTSINNYLQAGGKQSGPVWTNIQNVKNNLQQTDNNNATANRNNADTNARNDALNKENASTNNTNTTTNAENRKINEENRQLNINNERANNDNFKANEENKKANENNKIANQKGQDFNQQNTNLNNQNTKKNQAFDKTYSVAANTTGGDYLEKRNMIRQLEKEGLINETTKNKLETDFKDFYKNEKLKPWDPKTAAKPPSPGGTKELDLAFYAKQVPSLTSQWAEAVINDDLDIVGRYNNNWKDYFSAHYTTQGRLNGIRGYEEESTDRADDYVETPTDLDKQRVMDATLGAGAAFDTLIKSILGPKEEEETKQYSALVENTLKDTIAKLNKVKNQELQWDLYRNLDGFTEVMDLNKTLANSIMGDSGIGGYLAASAKKTEAELTTDLETQLEKATGLQSNVTYNWQKWFDDQLVEKYGIDYKQFQVTEDTLDIVNTALKTDPTKIYDKQGKKFTDEFIKKAGFNTNEALTEFLNKQGVTGTDLLSRLQNPTSNTQTELTTLKTNLEKNVTAMDATKNRDLKLTYKGADSIPEEVKVEASFARQFIDEYLKPRFDFSKSMDEFRDYLNVIEKDKNIFQTTDRSTEVKTYAQSVAKAIAPDLNTRFNYAFGQTEEGGTDFYFNPVDKYAPPEMQATYKKQKDMVAKDWETAKNNPDALVNPSMPYLGTWAENAYMYNVKDLSDKNNFAKLHYQIIGSLPAFGFDPAMNPSSVIKVKFESPITAKAASMETVFGEFTTPESYADTILKNIDPFADKETWEKLLEQYNLDEDATKDEIKKVIVDALTSGTAEEIRTRIKELQELEEIPTQEKLGVTYIERPEDNLASLEKTELYKIFKNAGYTGTEKDFYTDYMTDTSPEDVKLLTDATKGKLPEFDFTFDTKDPASALSKLKELETPSTKKTTDKTTSYFKIGLDDEEEEKETDPDSFLSDFAALFKK
jgi:hypothetical protein